MENEETKDIPGQEGGQEQQEVVVTEFKTPVKFGGIEVKTEADIAKAQEAYTAQAARATKAEQALAKMRADAAAAGTAKPTGEKKEEPKPTFLEQQAQLIEFNKNVDTYVDGQLNSFGNSAENKLLVEAFGDEAKKTIRNLVSTNPKGEEILSEVKMGQVFDAVISGVIKKGNTAENNEAYNKARNIRDFREGVATIKDVQEVFDHFKKTEGKPKINGKKIDIKGFDGGGDKNNFESQYQEIKSKVASGELSYRDSRTQIKALQKTYAKSRNN